MIARVPDASESMSCAPPSPSRRTLAKTSAEPSGDHAGVANSTSLLAGAASNRRPEPSAASE